MIRKIVKDSSDEEVSNARNEIGYIYDIKGVVAEERKDLSYISNINSNYTYLITLELTKTINNN